MQNLPLPGPLRLNGNKADDWRRWKQRWLNYYIGSGLRSKPNDVQTSTFLLAIQDEGLDMYNNFRWNEVGDETRLDKIIEKFEAYCVPRKNVTLERHVFNKRNQMKGESVEDYVKELQVLVRSCEYGELADSIVKDRIVAGLQEDRLRERLLEKADLSLEEAVRVLRAVEASREQSKSFAKKEVEREMRVEAVEREMRVEAVEIRQAECRPKTTRNWAVTERQEYREKNNYQHNKQHKYGKGIQQSNKEIIQCGRCGFKHKQGNCSAFGQNCFRCGGKNHFARMCNTNNQDRRFSKRLGENQRYVAVIDTENNANSEEHSDTETLFIGQIGANKAKGIEDLDWYEKVMVNGKQLRFKLDTGAQCSVLTKQMYQMISDKPLAVSKVKLKSYTQQVLKPIGETEQVCEWKGTKYKIKFQVVDGDYDAIIGRADCEKMKMIIRQVQTLKSEIKRTNTDAVNGTILEQYLELFEGVGTLPGHYRIEIDPTVNPVVHPPRRVPFALKAKIKGELDRMEKVGIISKISDNEPTDWVSSLVTVEKPNGEVRVCIDPKELNQAIKREHHPLNTVEEIAANVGDAKWFTVLDAKNAFHQIQLDEDSSKLLTFNTPFGRYKYLRMPMGIKSAPEVYQRKIQQGLQELEGMEVGMDDILIWGKDEEEHDRRLKLVLDRLRHLGVKLNRSKCKVKKEVVKFHGHLFTKEGLKVSEDRCKAIREMPVPESKEDVKRLLGMINYVGKFIPNLSQKSSPLRELLHKDVEWQWTDAQEESYRDLKEALIKPPVLAYYKPNEPLTLQVDSSSKGIGAVLIQRNRPIAYASKALSGAQQSYAQIEKEMLAILFGCTKFEDFIIGRETCVESDHKPLESIMRKPIFKAPIRLQRMMIQLQRYPGIEVTYKKGSQMYIADALSRAFLPKELPDYDELQIKAITVLPISKEKLDEFVKATEEDTVLRDLKVPILNGWPEEKTELTPELKHYWSYRDELTVLDGLIFKGSKVVVPKQLRGEMLQKLHESHMGIVKSKQRARDIFYWPGMNTEIESVVRKCAICSENQRDNLREPLQSHEIPDRPWAKIGTDLFKWRGEDYLLCVDYYSKFPEIVKLRTTTSRVLIQALKNIFSRHGVPEEVVSDNGPQYRSQEFRVFAEQWEFKHTPSSPYYPKSNGQAERTIQTVKQILEKSSDPQLSLLEYRNTPLDIVGLSPAQLLMSRRLRSKLPTSRELLTPEVHTGLIERLQERQKKQAKNYNKHSKPLTVLKEGETIGYRCSRRVWKPAIIQEKLPNRSYRIKTQQGEEYRRNRSHLRQTEARAIQETGYSQFSWENQPQAEQENRLNAADPGGIPNRQLNTQRPEITRSGRVVKKPTRMDL